MSGILRRRAMMIGGGDVVPFVNYIWPSSGNPSITIDYTPCYTRVEANIIFRASIPNDANNIMSLVDANEKKCAVRISSKLFYLWHQRTANNKPISGVQAQSLSPYTVIILSNNNISAQYLRVVQLNKNTSTVALDMYQRFQLNKDGTATIPVAYGPFTLYSISGEAGSPILTAFAKLRPCCYNGEYGMWDTMSGTFYGNTVSGASWTGGSVS